MKYIFILSMSLLTLNAYADSYYIIDKNNQPNDYSMNVKDPVKSAFEGYNNGINMARLDQKNKQEKIEYQNKISKIKREEDYRKDLRRVYESSKSLNDDSFQSLIINYPEYADTTLKVKESLNTLKKE
ncbi:hypothetical protein [Acinetobacter seifertii]|uniref:DUF4168 domain-containing protein n=1 Tax=Acinetobacter seifertii TaxID=1530123 RepID=A0ABX8LBX9_9GAMM|nr:hypothetical protein [Acinetobacter seifertii]QXB47653.1 hypothetical protein I6L30_06540 [Acinetobacter seifertii]